MEALILVDIQNDFLPGGALAVKQGDSIIPVVNRLQQHFDFIVATQDYHPQDHLSFAANHQGKEPGDHVTLRGLDQILWPVHCVQGTSGAEFADSLHMDKVRKVFQKGTDPEIDSYSGFYDNGHLKATGLGDYLRKENIQRLVIVGLAADYCVKFTALDAQQSGFETVVVQDATKAVNLHPDDFEQTLAHLQESGIQVVSSDVLLAQHKP